VSVRVTCARTEVGELGAGRHRARQVGLGGVDAGVDQADDDVGALGHLPSRFQAQLADPEQRSRDRGCYTRHGTPSENLLGPGCHRRPTKSGRERLRTFGDVRSFAYVDVVHVDVTSVHMRPHDPAVIDR
jgi:hypothetical protein